MAEFMGYLEEFPFAEVHTSGSAFGLIGSTMTLDQAMRTYRSEHPRLSRRVFSYDPDRIFPAQLTYAVFLNNISTVIEQVEQHRGAFVFTLYPGGGFCLDVPASDSKLQRALTSPSLRKVRTTASDQMQFIDPGVFPRFQPLASEISKKLYGRDKGTIDICFVAHKYMPGGRDKGYDVFTQCAKRLSTLGNHLQFHVVGLFSEDDADIAGFADQMHFHGTLVTRSLRQLYSGMDLIVSPNAPFILAPGAFDGFPTGSCLEAGLCGVAVFCTDELQENQYFIDGEDIVIISRKVNEICERIEYYLEHYELLLRIGINAKRVFGELAGWEANMSPRLKLHARGVLGR